MADEAVQALRDEIAALRAEVGLLRSQLAPQAFPPNASARCTCGTSARCTVHYPADWQGNVWIGTAPAAGCAGGYAGQAFTVDAGQAPLTFCGPAFTAAGCASGNTTYTVPLGN